MHNLLANDVIFEMLHLIFSKWNNKKKLICCSWIISLKINLRVSSLHWYCLGVIQHFSAQRSIFWLYIIIIFDHCSYTFARYKFVCALGNVPFVPYSFISIDIHGLTSTGLRGKIKERQQNLSSPAKSLAYACKCVTVMINNDDTF